MVRQSSIGKIRAVNGLYEWFRQRYERLPTYTRGLTGESSGIGNIRAIDGLYEWFRQRYERFANQELTEIFRVTCLSI
ncbi:hypothetical protein [Sporosarcina cyprini]|uniref:hypothetical protein n=1 Tax=Sporosarcina cyprini TaxID=2910523 RepID=UPI001EDE7E2A|nr:hypothetical protein [Sporosarcina cyprini]MCG3088148.1 hypothetical protein [Sporosarcina cyprini]